MVYNGLYRTNSTKLYKLFESVTDKSAGNKLATLRVGKIPMYVTALDKIMDVELKPIIRAVDIALGKICSKYSFMYSYIEHSRPMFVLTDPRNKNCIHDTMSVDDKGNLWLNVHFIYNNLDCDVNKIFGILFHELMHNFLNHISRSEKIWTKNDREKLYTLSKDMFKKESLKQNLCADMEVNCNMVADGVVTADFWKEMGGVFDENFFGKMFEEIYKNHGDELLKKYLSKGGIGLSDEYLKALSAVLEALKVLRDPDATDRDKDVAATKLRDIIESLFGESKTKMTIRAALKKLQKKAVKEFGEIGPYLKKVIDDLEVSPVYMTEDDIRNFINDVNTLKEEMERCVSEIAERFNLDEEVFISDNEECWTLLIDGVERLNKDPKMVDEKREEITEKIIYSIQKLISDNLKRDKLKNEFEKKMKEMKKKAKEFKKKVEEEKRKKHILYNYYLRIKDMAAIYHHKRIDSKLYELCNMYKTMVKPLLEKDIHDIKKSDVSEIYKILNKIKESFFDNLKRLKEEKVLWDREDSFFIDLVDRFYEDTTYMFDFLQENHTDTEIVSVVKIALSSWRRIGREFHRQAKVRPSEEFKKAYYAEYKRLYKIWEELGKKGLKRELGIPDDIKFKED